MTSPVRTSVVAADGGLIRFDLAELLGGAVTSMWIELSDATAAEPWLTRLCGPENALAAISLGQVEVPAVPELAELALLVWARRWWPASTVLGVGSLESALLDLEAAVVTAEVAEGLLDAFEATPAELFDAAADGDALLAAAAPVAGEVRGLCARLAEWFDEQDDVVRAEAAEELVERLETVAPSQRSYALAAGTPSTATGAGLLAEGRASVDWARVPPGVLDAAEDTVTWRIVTAAGATRMHVEVAGAFADAVLRAFATLDGEVFAEVPLALGAGSFAGSVGLDENATRLVANRNVHIGVAVGDEPVFVTTREDRAEVVSLVRSRDALPVSARTVAERAAAGSAAEEF